jgi:hypothetical protein
MSQILLLDLIFEVKSRSMIQCFGQSKACTLEKKVWYFQEEVGEQFADLIKYWIASWESTRILLAP